jgi:hypothetical protein
MADGREMLLLEREFNSLDRHKLSSWAEGYEHFPTLVTPDGSYPGALKQNHPVGFKPVSCRSASRPNSVI